MANLAQREPNNLMGLMDKVDEYINQEETLRTMIGSLKTMREPLEQNKDKYCT
jgi:hypothetical protein